MWVGANGVRQSWRQRWVCLKGPCTFELVLTGIRAKKWVLFLRFCHLYALLFSLWALGDTQSGPASPPLLTWKRVPGIRTHLWYAQWYAKSWGRNGWVQRSPSSQGTPETSRIQSASREGAAVYNWTFLANRALATLEMMWASERPTTSRFLSVVLAPSVKTYLATPVHCYYILMPQSRNLKFAVWWT